MFSIFDVAIGDAALALCPLPGRFSPYLNDFAAILAWRPDLVLSLTERSEMKPVGAADFRADLKAQGIQCCHFPILDYQTPKPENAELWRIFQFHFSSHLQLIIQHGIQVIIRIIQLKIHVCSVIISQHFIEYLQSIISISSPSSGN